MFAGASKSAYELTFDYQTFEENSMTRFLSATILFGILFAIPASVRAQDQARSDTTGLKKIARSVEDNFGILDKGELINVCGNQALSFPGPAP